jgi:hypothetical protein
MATTKTSGKRYSSKPPDVVKFYTSKGKASGQPWEYCIILEYPDGKHQRICFNEEEITRMREHLVPNGKL